MYNLSIVKKEKLEISGSHRLEIGKGGGLGATKFQRIKTPYGPLSHGVICEKDSDTGLGKDQTYTSIWCWWW